MLAIPPRPYDLSARSIRPMGGASHHLDLDEEDSRALASAWAHRHATVLDMQGMSATTFNSSSNQTTTALLPSHVDVPAVGEMLTILRLTSNVLAGALQFVTEQMTVVEQLESALTSGNEVLTEQLIEKCSQQRSRAQELQDTFGAFRGGELYHNLPNTSACADPQSANRVIKNELKRRLSIRIPGSEDSTPQGKISEQDTFCRKDDLSTYPSPSSGSLSPSQTIRTGAFRPMLMLHPEQSPAPRSSPYEENFHPLLTLHHIQSPAPPYSAVDSITSPPFSPVVPVQPLCADLTAFTALAATTTTTVEMPTISITTAAAPSSPSPSSSSSSSSSSSEDHAETPTASYSSILLPIPLSEFAPPFSPTVPSPPACTPTVEVFSDSDDEGENTPTRRSIRSPFSAVVLDPELSEIEELLNMKMESLFGDFA